MITLSFLLKRHPAFWMVFLGRLMINSKINFSKFIKNSIRLFIAAFVLMAAFFMTFLILTITTMVAFAVALRLWWKQSIRRRQQPVDRQSTKTTIDAEYTVVEK
tara:strand:- start:3529 stop:3840 length:312 start_codon:yes stop_codon:yes gene_type:complete